ncbi:MAG: VWA domain-containing protein [Bdellovibrionales bacterium]|nr:VWA domain-containing protein [Bdellovibrionales bacterium]
MIWQSWWFLSFLVFLLAAAILHVIRRKQRYGALPLSTLSIAKEVSRSPRTYLKSLPEILKYIGLILAVLALARPQKTDEKIQRNVEGIDIMMALDISHSMLIEDMKPENRLESAKKTIREFIEKRISDRIGLVVFSGESYTRVPLTLDYKILKQNLKEVETSTNIKMGTAIGVALGNAVSRLNESTAKSRVVILLTDGENNTGLIDPQTALKIAKGYGVRIYTIGVGRDGQAQLPIYSTDVFGRKVKRYQPIHSKVNVDLLEQLAKETGGKFYRATNTNSLEGVFTDIDQLEKTKIEENKYTKYTELFYSFLFWGFIFYILGIFLQTTILRRGV